MKLRPIPYEVQTKRQYCYVAFVTKVGCAGMFAALVPFFPFFILGVRHVCISILTALHDGIGLSMS